MNVVVLFDVCLQTKSDVVVFGRRRPSLATPFDDGPANDANFSSFRVGRTAHRMDCWRASVRNKELAFGLY